MALTLAILNETSTGETRVSATPDMVKKYKDLGCDVLVSAGAGGQSAYGDEAFKQAGATITKTNDLAVSKADIVLCVNTPADKMIAKMKKGALVMGQLSPFEFNAKPFKDAGVTAIAMELMPRITRAQNMDVLSSQSNLAGYQAVIEGAHAFGRAMPMMMTAAGTVAPAKVFVMGAGVAGLQAIATARRLGAVVSATDVRLAAKEQVESLGAKFVFVDDEEAQNAETAGGYAKEMSAAYKKKQAALIAETIAKQDIVITTALIPGRPAPELVSEEMVKSMAEGSVIVDLAAPRGGNCPLTEAGKTVVKHGVTIIGHTNLAGHIAADASALYARNLYNLVALLWGNDKAKIDLKKDEEIVRAIALVEKGKAVHDLLKPKAKAKPAVKKKAPAKKTAAKAATKKTIKPPVKKTAKKTATKPKPSLRGTK